MKTLALLLLAVGAAHAEHIPFPGGKAINPDQLMDELITQGYVCRVQSTTTAKNCEYHPNGIVLVTQNETTERVKKVAIADVAAARDAVAVIIDAHKAAPIDFTSPWEKAQEAVKKPGVTRDEQLDAVIKLLGGVPVPVGP